MCTESGRWFLTARKLYLCRMKMLQYMLLPGVILVTIVLSACGSSQGSSVATEVETVEPQQSQGIFIEPARYRAQVNLEHVPDSMRAFSMTSEVFFGLEENNRFVYQVEAMGRKMDDVGKWAVQGDSLYIFDLERGPNTRFKLVDNGDGTFNIYGPNNFILSKDEAIEPTKN